ncbi:hypothetical protein CC658_23480 [Salmonella enterica subsp. enterica serovar Koketime]|uniref:Uncharacterized protein n=2 Tax=Salmonella enterica TaxID=28901 RepID=A0A742TU45_SALER|nr:hypothetical protein [Salmonella enterica subsp. enterica serovar Koketime]EAM8930562.1 hypothetical protein [Salmonella enterica]EBU8262663.1 hypothetical protein [Salmonella enterica subsp. enterica serovar Stuttgart]EBB4437950.1 hypothetical protein [Salmonella enterica]EBR9057158.1 hypothetical protein [Salmonella enterica subsp. enterica serovar Koketime]
MGIVHGGVSVLKVRSAPCAGTSRFGFGSLAARPQSYWQYGHSALCASAFQECMTGFADNGITATAFGGRGQRDLLLVAE